MWKYSKRNVVLLAEYLIGFALLLSIGYSLICVLTFPMPNRLAGPTGMEELSVENLTWPYLLLEHCISLPSALLDLIF